MPKVFLTYRRDDTLSFTGRLDERLTARFGRSNVFRDLDSVAGGAEFRKVILEQLRKCDVCLVIIGDRWLTPRLDEAEDLVRVEIETALNLGLRVIPVLTGKAVMAAKADLPVTLQPLVDRNAVEIREVQFDRDAKALMSQLGGNGRRWLALAAAILLVTIGGWWFTTQSRTPPPPPIVEQNTSGSQSPAVQGVKGSVTIIYGSEKKDEKKPEEKK